MCSQLKVKLFAQQFWPCKIRGRTGQTIIKVVCDACYVKFRRDQQNKNIDLCQFCWRDIDEEEKKANLKLRFKVSAQSQRAIKTLLFGGTLCLGSRSSL